MQNPTISYLPVQGDNHLRQLLSPIPLEASRAHSQCLSRYRGLSHIAGDEHERGTTATPPSLQRPKRRETIALTRLPGSIGTLARAGALRFVESGTKEPRFSLLAARLRTRLSTAHQ